MGDIGAGFAVIDPMSAFGRWTDHNGISFSRFVCEWTMGT
jgi:hypothetical protein